MIRIAIKLPSETTHPKLNRKISGLIPAAKNNLLKWFTNPLKLYVDLLCVVLLVVSTVETFLDIQPSATSRNDPLFA